MKFRVTKEIITERGSLVLSRDEHNIWVEFADWYDPRENKGTLDYVSKWFEILDGRGEGIRLNGSQVQTVKQWAKEFTL